MSSRFYFGDDSVPSSQTESYNNDADYDEDTPLPFPKPLSRPSFLTRDFEPHAFLSSLSTSNRFQTLEDLQSELRELSTAINKELVDLVNANYTEFVSLGADLRGGEEKVEEVRVGLLGFEKDVMGLRERVVGRCGEVKELVVRKKELRREIGLGRGLLEVDERLEELERRVGLRDKVVVDKKGEDHGAGDGDVNWSDGWDEDSLEESDGEFDQEDGVPARVRVLVEKYLIVKTLIKRYDSGHPFLVAQKERIHRVQDRVRVEVEMAVRGADELAVKQKLIQMRTQMDE